MRKMSLLVISKSYKAFHKFVIAIFAYCGLEPIFTTARAASKMALNSNVVKTASKTFILLVNLNPIYNLFSFENSYGTNSYYK